MSSHQTSVWTFERNLSIAQENALISFLNAPTVEERQHAQQVYCQITREFAKLLEMI